MRYDLLYAHTLNAYLHRIQLRHDPSFATPALICVLFDHIVSEIIEYFIEES
jgi:hypothetical protein